MMGPVLDPVTHPPGAAATDRAAPFSCATHSAITPPVPASPASAAQSRLAAPASNANARPSATPTYTTRSSALIAAHSAG